jgi:hypothetical protein
MLGQRTNHGSNKTLIFLNKETNSICIYTQARGSRVERSMSRSVTNFPPFVAPPMLEMFLEEFARGVMSSKLLLERVNKGEQLQVCRTQRGLSYRWG